MTTPIFDSLLTVSQTVTGSGNGASIQVDKHMEVAIFIRVGTVTGTTPTLDIAFEGSVDGSTGWTQLVKHPQLTSTSANKTYYGIKYDMSSGGYRFIRPVYTAGGTTPSFGIDIKYTAY